MGHRNSILHLLEIYEILLQERQTFNAIRNNIGMGYHSLRSLMDKLLGEDFVFEQVIDGVTYYRATSKLVELFQGKFYDGVKELQDL